MLALDQLAIERVEVLLVGRQQAGLDLPPDRPASGSLACSDRRLAKADALARDLDRQRGLVRASSSSTAFVASPT